jgi:hypothetical protein
MLKPMTTDSRAELINWEVLASDSFPPIDEWDEDDWDDAALATLVHYYLEEDRKSGKVQPTISFEEVLAKRGLTLDDLK